MNAWFVPPVVIPSTIVLAVVIYGCFVYFIELRTKGTSDGQELNYETTSRTKPRRKGRAQGGKTAGAQSSAIKTPGRSRRAYRAPRPAAATPEFLANQGK